MNPDADVTAYYRSLTPKTAGGFRDAIARPLMNNPEFFVSAEKERAINGKAGPGLIYREDETDEAITEKYRKVGRRLSRATIVLWRADLWIAATRGCEVFMGKPFEEKNSPSNNLFLLPDNDITLTPESHAGLNLPPFINVIIGVQVESFTPGDIAQAIALARREGDEDFVARLGTWATNGLIGLTYFLGQTAPYMKQNVERYGPLQAFPAIRQFRIPQKIEAASHKEATIIALLEFMNMPVVEVARDHSGLSRPVRRLALRKGVALPDVRVVRLRRVRHIAADGASAAPVDWHWQWIVSGHWRNQWFAKSKDHKPIFIAPHVKGPQDKPLKPKVDPLYIVNR